LDKDKIVKALEGLSMEIPVGKIHFRAEDHQAVTVATWGKTKLSSKYPFAILDPIKIFPGEKVTRPVNLTGCNLK